MKPANAFCSFCRKSYRDVGPLVEGPDEVYICGDCLELCQSILDQEKRRRGLVPARAAPDAASLRATLDRLVPSQEEAKSVLCEAAFRRDNGKGRVLLIGPSQCAAMLCAKAAAFALDVPFAAGDWNGLAKTGQENLFFELLTAAEFDLAATQRGVVFVRGTEAPEAQDALLKIWQETVAHPIAGLPIDTRGLLFVCGGAFAGLDEAIVRLGRHPEQTITAESLTAVGSRREWSAALTAIARVAPLDEESLERLVNWADFRRANSHVAQI